ncbi:hypothetical protein [Streptomyces sp. NPDC048111]|uniref:hypothetical protein n=1 Tax=Streptomyces sp. NPDC048111 TaxID=3365500 RepID=UPI003711557B
MTETLVSSSQDVDQQRTEGLDIPLRRPTTQSPYWHRDEPVVAVARVDPEYARLREHFPQGWLHLVHAKSLFDGIAALDVPHVPSERSQEQSLFLVRAAAQELVSFAELETTPGTEDAVAHALEVVARLDSYARTGTWEPITLRPPQPGSPWLYCGPIASWAMRTARRSIGFLVAAPAAGDLQEEVDMVTLRTDWVRERVAQILGGPVRSSEGVQPGMHVLDLLLSGGESAVGHKNFAHFFPLEAAGSRVQGPEFTVVFANIHRSRIQHCSLRLFREIQGRETETRLDGLVRNSLRWFRGHDLGHFWRKESVVGDGAPAEGLTAFELMGLEETYADVLGLLSARLFASDLHLSEAYRVELFRYLSRRHDHFADSTAAVLTAGWLRLHDVSLEPEPGRRWLMGAQHALGELAGALHRTLWEQDSSALPTLRAAIAAGSAYQRQFSDTFGTLPTDLSYTFG